MGKQGKQGKGGKSRGAGEGRGQASAGAGFVFEDVDPRRVRFAHSKIRPVFSGCGRTIEQTLGEIRRGETSPEDLPAITVLRGGPEGGEPWYFSLNNRRLYVLKTCREEGLLGAAGTIRVRVRAMKDHERERYTLERCALSARYMHRPPREAGAEGALPGPEVAGKEGAAEEEEGADASTGGVEEAVARERGVDQRYVAGVGEEDTEGGSIRALRRLGDVGDLDAQMDGLTTQPG